ncbi:MAG: hypothetical protein JKY61_13050 [Planctomycetes bacterium]|nr:hypothetical protein [Planctomycetota bacterium]
MNRRNLLKGCAAALMATRLLFPVKGAVEAEVPQWSFEQLWMMGYSYGFGMNLDGGVNPIPADRTSIVAPYPESPR